ncbi:hypothetical protein F2Q70_00027968 [Brassica cretica]|uniref:Uncharacterized protein n=1 Tax=Brassica cretica TaxID=69181 RepID=A0A8S9LCU3_BRACR|nr:hypothetical protein F2Q68_00004718 [Brassica cretica]KAF2603989.1 hypothetical protein F2Q70_00027968 [Brassica cretica]
MCRKQFHAARHTEARGVAVSAMCACEPTCRGHVSRCMNTRHAEGQVDVEVSYGMARRHATGHVDAQISPDQSTQDIYVGFWDLTSRYQDDDLEGIKGVPDIGDGCRARIAGPV